jgi:hypothetical protein
MDRDALKRALDAPFDPIAMAKDQIRRLGKSDEEVEAELEQVLSLNPGLAHRTAAMTYQKRNIAEGKCCVCPKPLARHSVRYCEKHLTAARLRMTPSKGKPGSVGWLYGGDLQRGTTTALVKSREKYIRSSQAEKALYERVATELGVSAQHVRGVALGQTAF